jgi:serine/threonine protein phosphatase PrpC
METQTQFPGRGHLYSNLYQRTMDLTDETLSNITPSGLEHGIGREHDSKPELSGSEPTQAAATEDLQKTSAVPSTSTGSATGIRLEVSALTDIGCVRTNNEDCFGYNDALGLYVVCDGMGGMASGEVASANAAAKIIESFMASASSGIPTSTRLLQAIADANTAVWQYGQIPEHRGMGTTVVAAALDGNQLVIGNVGDSRAYMVESGQCMQLTVDHSYVNELIRNGTLTVENAHNADLNGMESVITRAIGVNADVQPDFFSVDLHPGTTVLLATDGLTRYLLQDEIALVLINSPFEATCSNLIQLAKERGGHDNITCLLLRPIALS